MEFGGSCGILIIICLVSTLRADYLVGTGIGDCTGPIVEINFLGYGTKQVGSGLHLRQFARCYIIEKDFSRIAFVSIDSAMIGFAVRTKVLEELIPRYGNMYNEQNLILSSTHTHSAPGGYMEDVLYDFSTAGFVRESFLALVKGIIEAIDMAHNSMENAKIYYKSGTLLNANINRSPLAYLLNPQIERAEYSDDVDKEIVQLKFVASPSGKLLGVINWFPVHPTSMNNTNTLVSSDNVGYASITLEKYYNEGIIGEGPFVASFASTNLGDVSPNINGPKCIDTGDPCDNYTSTCNGRPLQCIASGPGTNMFESTKIIGTRMYEKALEMLESGNGTEVDGPIRFGHQYVNMPTKNVLYTLGNGTMVQGHGCVPALGYSFGAGTTDGPGSFMFHQCTNTTNLFWKIIGGLIGVSTPKDDDCQCPKPILLNTGRAYIPYRWQPSIVSVQIAILGNIVLTAVPSEFTTMAGRRFKKTLKETIEANGGAIDSKIIIAGLSNLYSSYVTTYEEYQMQRYEGASTLYGPHTLGIYQDTFKNLLTSLMTAQLFDLGVPPEKISENHLISFTLPVILDYNFFYKFGYCKVHPPFYVTRGTTVTAQFVSSNPRSGDLSTYKLVEIQKMENGVWIIVATDANWEIKYYWKRVGLAGSEVTITWFVDMNIPLGRYRIVHNGYYKVLFGSPNYFTGSSNAFYVV